MLIDNLLGAFSQLKSLFPNKSSLFQVDKETKNHTIYISIIPFNYCRLLSVQPMFSLIGLSVLSVYPLGQARLSCSYMSSNVIYLPSLFSSFKLITLGRCVAYTGFLMTEDFLQEKLHFLLLFEQEGTVHGVLGAVFFSSRLTYTIARWVRFLDLLFCIVIPSCMKSLPIPGKIGCSWDCEAIYRNDCKRLTYFARGHIAQR